MAMERAMLVALFAMFLINFMLFSHFLFLDKFLLTEKGLTLVVEHTFDLGFEGRKNDVIEKGVHTAEDYSTDYDADDDLYAGIDVAFCGGVFDDGFCGDRCGTCFMVQAQKKKDKYI